jgi:lysophospholipase L1-like esterase
MAVGDSITFGCGYQAKPPTYGLECSGGDSSYRGKLYELLTAGGHTVQMVGRAKSGDPRDTGFPPAQHAHEGYSGARIDQLDAILYGAKPWTAAAPDVMLVMLGTNDIWHLNSTVPTMRGRMESFLNHTYAKMPRAKVFLASITNMAGKVNLSDHDPLGKGCPGHLGHKGGESCCWGCRKYWPPMVAGLNAMLKDQVASHKAAGRNIEFVDLFTESKVCSAASSPEADACCHAYHVHPTKMGYEKLAAVWAKHVGPHLKTTDADALLVGYDTASVAPRR